MKKSYYVILALTLLFIVSTGVNGQNLKDPLTKRNVTITGRFKAGIWEAVYKLATLGIPIGFEAREHWAIDTEPRVVMKSGKLEDILDSICVQSEYYTWDVNDGIINIFPKSDRNQKSLMLLSSRAGSISVHKGDGRAIIIEKLKNQFPERFENSVDFVSAIEKENYLGLPDRFTEDFSISESDLRTALNNLTKHMAFSPIWTLTPDKAGNSFIVFL